MANSYNGFGRGTPLRPCRRVECGIFVFKGHRPHPLPHRMRQVIRDLPGSKIREVANAGARPQRRAAVLVRRERRGDAGVHPRGGDPLARATARPSIRTTSACPSCARRWRTTSARCIRPVDAGRIAVTSSGVNALMLAMQALVGAGDEVVAVTPVWPNLTAQPAILGARVRARAAAGASGGAWRLDLDALRAAVTLAHPGAARQRAEQPDRLDADPRRAAGAPRPLPAAPAPGSSPTRSTSASTSPARPALRAELPRHRRARRPSRRRAQLLEELPDDRLAARLDGRCRRRWSPRARQADRVQHLVRAGVRAARRPGRAGPGRRHRARAGRAAHAPAATRCCRVWPRCPASRWPTPAGGMYAFFRVEGEADSLALAKRLVAEAGARPGAGRRLRRRRARAGCAGASPRATRRGWCRGSSGCSASSGYNHAALALPQGDDPARRRSVSPAFASQNPKPWHRALSGAGARFHN